MLLLPVLLQLVLVLLLVIWRGGHRVMSPGDCNLLVSPGRREPGGEPVPTEGLPIVDILEVGEPGPKDTVRGDGDELGRGLQPPWC